MWLGFVSPSAVPASIVCNGIALARLWSWFIVTTFELPEISLGEAIEITLGVSYVQPDVNTL